MLIKQIDFGSELYQEFLDFRFRILRQPLNLQWSKKDLEGEENQFHIAAIKQNKIVGSCVLNQLTQIL